jgi:hypothetical protein
LRDIRRHGRNSVMSAGWWRWAWDDIERNGVIESMVKVGILRRVDYDGTPNPDGEYVGIAAELDKSAA